MKNNRWLILVCTWHVLSTEVTAQIMGRSFEPPIPERTIHSILDEASGENAYEHIRYLSSFARYPNSSGFHRAAEYVAAAVKKMGLTNVNIEAFKTDEPSWDYLRATLTITSPALEKLADTDQIGVSLCNNSNDAEVETDLVDVGAGTLDQDYEGKDIKGKIVLASGHPYSVQKQAVIERGAAGLISFFSNSFFGVQPSRDVISWTGIRAKSDDGKSAGFGFMLSPNAGTRLSERLKDGEKIKVHASVTVKAISSGKLEMVTAEIPGPHPANDDVVLSAHLDHQPPGANDNASGSAALLEIARTVKSLVQNGSAPSLQRTLRSWWVTEIQGTVYENAAINVPSVSIAYPSFHYIHTSDDGIEHIDATTLKRSIFFGTAMAIYLASPVKGERTPFETEVAARLNAEAERAWASAFDLLASSTAESVHADYLRAVAIAKTGTDMANLAFVSFGRLGRPNPVTDNLFSANLSLSQLRGAYQKRCRQLGVQTTKSALPKDGEKYSKLIPHRTIALGLDYEQWQTYNIPEMSYDAGSELKNFIDGKRSVVDIWQYLVAEHPKITLDQVLTALNKLKDKSWIVLK